MSLFCVNDYENHAKKVLPKTYFSYISSGAGQQRTLEWNKAAFARYRIRPKYMRIIANENISTNILGKIISFPIGISPTAYHKLCHPDGECATARAAESLDTIFILSSHSNTSIEEVAISSPNGHKWMQFHVLKNKEVTKKLLRSVEAAGFEAIVLIVDFPILGRRRNSIVLPSGMGEVIYEQYFDPLMLKNCDFSDTDTDWDYIKWLKTITLLPIVIKGILTAEDAISAVKAGASAILVSNHGGRQLDTVPSTIEALPEVIKAVGNQVDVYMDGGIRNGTDIFKAIALGARMVFVGRPILWGLAHNGEAGAKKVLSILKEELHNVMTIAGCATLKNVTRDMVVHESFYHKL